MIAQDVKLFLGSGPLPIHPQHLEYVDDSWTLIDLFVDHPDVVRMDARKLDYPNGSVSAIYTSHTLEHVGHREVLDTLREWHRVLKPGGWIVINVPDFEWACERWLANFRAGEPTGSEYYRHWSDFWSIFFGTQEHEGEYHKTGFTDVSLRDALERAGFKEVEVAKEYEAHEMQCVIAKATKGKRFWR